MQTQFGPSVGAFSNTSARTHGQRIHSGASWICLNISGSPNWLVSLWSSFQPTANRGSKKTSPCGCKHIQPGRRKVNVSVALLIQQPGFFHSTTAPPRKSLLVVSFLEATPQMAWLSCWLPVNTTNKEYQLNKNTPTQLHFWRTLVSLGYLPMVVCNGISRSL